MIKIGELAPNFTLPGSDNTTHSLSDYLGKKIVLYFYPKDSTPGCTTQACDFRDSLKDFSDLNAVIIGISKDPIKSHHKFTEKYNLPFLLLSDEEKVACNLYEVIKEKTLYGKLFMGIERSTFVIDENGILVKEYRKVKVKEHISTVLEDLRN